MGRWRHQYFKTRLLTYCKFDHALNHTFIFFLVIWEVAGFFITKTNSHFVSSIIHNNDMMTSSIFWNPFTQWRNIQWCCKLHICIPTFSDLVGGNNFNNKKVIQIVFLYWWRHKTFKSTDPRIWRDAGLSEWQQLILYLLIRYKQEEIVKR